jgi:hypothetical protein
MIFVPQVPSGNDRAAEPSDSERAARKIKTLEVLGLQIPSKEQLEGSEVGRDVAYLPSVTRKESLVFSSFLQ